MANGIYKCVGGVVRKVKSPYKCIGGIIRKIKKVYKCIGGVIKLVYSAEPLWSGTTTMPSTRGGIASASFNNLALFFGGTNGTATNQIVSFNTSLVRSILSSTLINPAPPYKFTATTANNVGVSVVSWIEFYNTSMVRVKTEQPSIYGMSGGSVNGVMFFAGGSSASGSYPMQVGYKEDASLVSTYMNILDTAKRNVLASNTLNHVIYAGGGNDSNSYLTSVDAINSSGVKATAPASLAVGWHDMGSKVGNYALFAGSYYTDTSMTAYDNSLVRTFPSGLSVARMNGGTATTPDYAIFSGGNYYGTVYDTVDMFDASLVRTTSTLSSARSASAGAKVGDYVLFAGGQSGSTYVDTVDIFGI